MLVGDSIRLGYAPLVVERLAGQDEVVSPQPNGADSANVLAHLDQWVAQERPDLVHLNCGLHDLKRSKATGDYQVPLERYEANLREIVRRVRAESRARLVFATTTPILDARHAQRRVDFDRFEADVQRYNAVAVQVMRDLHVPVNDLHQVVVEGDPETLLGPDGTHYTPEGYALLAGAVATTIRHYLQGGKP